MSRVSATATNVICRAITTMLIRFVLDDFGAGYASIAYLRKLAVQAIKIGRSFVAALDPPSERVLVDSLIGWRRNLDLECVADDVGSRRAKPITITV